MSIGCAAFCNCVHGSRVERQRRTRLSGITSSQEAVPGLRNSALLRCSPGNAGGERGLRKSGTQSRALRPRSVWSGSRLHGPAVDDERRHSPQSRRVATAWTQTLKPRSSVKNFGIRSDKGWRSCASSCSGP